jgi:hypothetical protein
MMQDNETRKGREMKGGKFIAVLLAAALTAGFCFAGDIHAANIKVGAAINLTGPASTWGQYHAKGQQDYFGM